MPVFIQPPRAPYAADPNTSRGRLYDEPESATRNPFQRDHDRIVHASAFRRLKQKTQVFVAHEGDHYRTRLTHSLEVSQIARAIARNLGLDQDLAETVALAHDLGHPPFGHAGEDALKVCMADHGGFDHNVQTFRILTELELRYPAFDGLNLCWETLEGAVKHNGPLAQPVPIAIDAYCQKQDLEVATFASAEAQVAALADDIAYNNHDIDDGLRAGLFTVEDLTAAVPLAARVFTGVWADYPDIARERQINEAIRRLMGLMIVDCMGETRRRAEAHKPQSSADVRAMGQALVAFSDPMLADVRLLRDFLFARMYRHTSVNRKMSQARRLLGQLFELFLAEPDLLPESWRARVNRDDTARVVCDYIAGMTDGFAIEEHRRLFNLERMA